MAIPPSRLANQTIISNLGVGFVDTPKDLSPSLLETISDPNIVKELDYYKKLFSTNLLIIQPVESVVVGTDFGSVLDTYASTTLFDGSSRVPSAGQRQNNQNIENSTSGQIRLSEPFRLDNISQSTGNTRSSKK